MEQECGTSPAQPLKGVRVIDSSASYAGPTASMYLADMGAEVIKVERPRTGDDTRHWGPPFVGAHSAWFMSANRNKRSVSINLAAPRGQQVLDRLLSGAHVFLQSMNPVKLLQLGLAPDQVRERHPHVVYCALSGFGLTGPDKGLPGYDLVAQARSGLMSVTGESPRAPQRVSTALSDVATAMVASFSITAALRHQERTGQGSLIDVSLLDADLALMAPRIASFLAGEPEPEPCGATDSVLAVYQTFDAIDRPFVVAVGNDRMWVRLCEQLALDDLLGDPELSDNAGRRRQRERIVERLSEVFRTGKAADWVGQLNEAGVPCSLIHSLSEVVADDQVQARSAIVDLPTPEGGSMAVVASPWRLGSGGGGDHHPPSVLGGDTRDVLRGLGYSADDIEGLIGDEAVWAPA